MGVVARSHAIALGQRSREEIKRASERVYYRSNVCVQDGWQRRFLERYPSLPASLRIQIDDSQIYVVLVPFQEPPFEDWDLGFAPIDGGLGI